MSIFLGIKPELTDPPENPVLFCTVPTGTAPKLVFG